MLRRCAGYVHSSISVHYVGALVMFILSNSPLLSQLLK